MGSVLKMRNRRVARLFILFAVACAFVLPVVAGSPGSAAAYTKYKVNQDVDYGVGANQKHGVFVSNRPGGLYMGRLDVNESFNAIGARYTSQKGSHFFPARAIGTLNNCFWVGPSNGLQNQTSYYTSIGSSSSGCTTSQTNWLNNRYNGTQAPIYEGAPNCPLPSDPETTSVANWGGYTFLKRDTPVYYNVPWSWTGTTYQALDGAAQVGQIPAGSGAYFRFFTKGGRYAGVFLDGRSGGFGWAFIDASAIDPVSYFSNPGDVPFDRAYDCTGTLPSSPVPNMRIDVFARDKASNHLVQNAWQGWAPGNQWSGWNDLGGEIGSNPSVASWESGRLDVFAKGFYDDNLYHKAYANSWYSWENQGGSVESGPGSVSWSPGRIDTFAAGKSNHHLVQLAWTGGWSWNDLGGEIGSAATVASWNPGRLDVFAKGYHDDTIYHRAYDSNWYGWDNIGGSISGAPAAVSWAADRIDVFARDKSTNHLIHKYWFGSGWSDWIDLGGEIGSSPAVASIAPGKLDVFAKGYHDDSIYQRTYDLGQWSQWKNIGGNIDGAPAAVAW